QMSSLPYHSHRIGESMASQWFTSLPAGSISSYSEIRELFLNEFTTSIDNTKHPINLLAVVQKPNETTRMYIEVSTPNIKQSTD
ncbi:hypothetical protein PIB30_103086, partial [Stylosanthes scabra]|nr:hypothetical protein [Stylosanthes scabra]